MFNSVFPSSSVVGFLSNLSEDELDLQWYPLTNQVRIQDFRVGGSN